MGHPGPDLDPDPSQAADGGGLLGKRRGTTGLSPRQQDREGSAPRATPPLEEDDVFLAAVLFVEWCGGQWQGGGGHGGAPRLEGEALRRDVGWGRATGFCGGHRAVAAEQDGAQRAAVPSGVLVLAHELAEEQLLLQVEGG